MKCMLCMLASDTNQVPSWPAQCGCRNGCAMSSAASLDAAIKQVNDLIIQLETGTPQPSTAKNKPQLSKPATALSALPSSGKPAVTTAATAGKTSSKQQSGNNAQPTVAELFAKAQLQVAKVTTVEEIDSAKLYKCTVDVGGDAVKHVMAGLKQHIAKDKLLHSLVIVITNLKPAKLAGELSEVMILAAQAPQPDSPQGEVVNILQPPDGSVAGDVVYLEGSAPSGSYPKQLKSDIWRKIVAEFKAMQGAAYCANHKLCTQKGVISVPSDMPDGSGIH